MSQKATIHIETITNGTSTEWTVTGEVRLADTNDRNDTDDIEMDTATAGDVVLDFDDFVAEHGSVALRDKWEQELRDEAFECYDGAPRYRDTYPSGMTDVQRHVPGVRALS